METAEGWKEMKNRFEVACLTTHCEVYDKQTRKLVMIGDYKQCVKRADDLNSLFFEKRQ
jgi:hypothetical protein